MIKKRDRDDIIYLIDKHKRIIYSIVNSYCPYANEQEDLIQEIIFHIVKAYDRFDHKVKITTWIYRIALNVSISHYRKVKRSKEYIVSMPDKLVNVGDKDNKPDDDILVLREFIQELRPLDRSILVMYLDGNSHTDISDAVGISVSNVGTKIGRIKNLLKSRFNKLQ